MPAISVCREKINPLKGKDKDQNLIKKVNSWDGKDMVELKKILKQIVKAD